MRAWIARRPGFHLHFTPTHASWLNQVERWFALLGQRAIQRSTFRSVTELKQQIAAFAEKCNESSKPSYGWQRPPRSLRSSSFM